MGQVNSISASCGGISESCGLDSRNREAYQEILNCYNLGNISSSSSDCGGIVGSLYPTYEGLTAKMENVINLGNITYTANKSGEIAGLYRNCTSFTSNNIFYLAGDNKKGIGNGTIEGDIISTQINENLITQLNEYVTNYNTTNANNSDYIQLKTWKLNGTKVEFE